MGFPPPSLGGVLTLSSPVGDSSLGLGAVTDFTAIRSVRYLESRDMVALHILGANWR